MFMIAASCAFKSILTMRDLLEKAVHAVLCPVLPPCYSSKLYLLQRGTCSQQPRRSVGCGWDSHMQCLGIQQHMCKTANSTGRTTLHLQHMQFNSAEL
jgi:hypothetical protein